MQKFVPDMQKKVYTLKEIADIAGVSTALVSLVLNGKQKQYRISDEVADRVRSIAKEYNYKPNGFAKSLKAGKSNIIGVIVSDISNPYFSDVAKVIGTAAEERGYMAMFSNSDESADRMDEIVDRMLAKEVDGFIIVPSEGSEETIGRLRRRDVPVVLIDRTFPDADVSSVCLDNFEAGYMSTRQLLAGGYRKIAIFAYDMKLSQMQGRIDGYVQAMAEAGERDAAGIYYIDRENLEESCYDAVRGALDAGVDAMIFATNTIAVHCLYLIRDLGISIPDRLGLVGFDGDAAFDFFHSSISYVMQPREMMARKAVEILLDSIESKDNEVRKIQASGTFVRRASSSRN